MEPELIKYKLLCLIIGLLVPGIACAQPYVHSSDICDFEVTVPYASDVIRECTGEEDAPYCLEKFFYTQTFGAQSSVKMEFTCSSLNGVAFENYNEAKMKFAAESLVRAQGNLESYDLNYTEAEDSKRVFIIGSGNEGVSEMIYLGHIWLGHSSLLSANMKVIGPASDEADRVLQNIIKSFRLKQP